MVFASVVRVGRDACLRGLLFCLNAGFGDRQAGRIANRPEDLGPARLAKADRGTEEKSDNRANVFYRR